VPHSSLWCCSCRLFVCDLFLFGLGLTRRYREVLLPERSSIEDKSSERPSPYLLAHWPLQDIVLLRGFCARIMHLCIAPFHLHCPHYCNSIARLLRNIRRPPDSPFVAIHHIILVMAISCKGQLAACIPCPPVAFRRLRRTRARAVPPSLFVVFVLVVSLCETCFSLSPVHTLSCGRLWSCSCRVFVGVTHILFTPLHIFPPSRVSSVEAHTSASRSALFGRLWCCLAFTRYCHYQYCMVYGIRKGGRGGRRILRNRRAMVLQ